MLILWIILFSILGSVGAIVTASIFLKIDEEKQKTLIPSLISYATGTLLAAALLGMITQAISKSDTTLVLVGIVLFFLLEKMVIWRHCHHRDCEVHGSAGPILLIGDAFHNFIDGLVIAASFLISIPIGLVASISVIAHEIPQEVGDFAILLDSDYSKKKAFLYNLLTRSTSIPAAII